jgi:hypothetical protein
MVPEQSTAQSPGNPSTISLALLLVASDTKQVDQLKAENEELRKQNRHLSAAISRKKNKKKRFRETLAKQDSKRNKVEEIAVVQQEQQRQPQQQQNSKPPEETENGTVWAGPWTQG